MLLSLNSEFQNVLNFQCILYNVMVVAGAYQGIPHLTLRLTQIHQESSIADKQGYIYLD